MRRFRSLALTGAVLAVVASTVLGVGRAYANPTGNDPRSILIILVNWTAGNGSPAAPPDSVTPQSAVAQIGATDMAWYQSVSYGQFPGWNAGAVGWYTIAPPPMGPDHVCGNAFRATIENEGKAAAAANGYHAENYSVVMYYFSRVPSCDWAGEGFPNGPVWINGSMTTGTTVHELGHTLGLGHGHALHCYDASNNPVTLSTNCTGDGYGDLYSAMGCCASGHFTTIQKADLGWMWGRMLDVPDSGGTFRLAPLEVNGPFFLYALRIMDGSTTLWLEYRQPIGVDSFLQPMSAGVVVHRQMPDQDGSTPLGSYLLDMTPGSPNGFNDAPLPVGATWANPLGTMKITVDWADGGAAQVTIASTIVRVAVPDVRGETVTDARAILQADGLRVGSIAAVVDPTCNNIGLVTGQNPTTGTVVVQGSAVNLSVGKAPAPPRSCQ